MLCKKVNTIVTVSVGLCCCLVRYTYGDADDDGEKLMAKTRTLVAEKTRYNTSVIS
jgi:hypothetical protein